MSKMKTKTIFSNLLQHSEKTAVVANGVDLTYAQLSDKAVTMSQNLVKLGVMRGDVIALYSDRSVNTVIGMLAIMMAGASYTVIEITEKKIECVNHTKEVSPDYVLTETLDSELFVDHFNIFTYQQLLEVTDEKIELPDLHTNDIAYVLYTSGSTGKPKGVKISYGNIQHYTTSIAAVTDITSSLNYGHLSTLAADLGNTSLFLSLHTGGCLHLIDQYTRKDPKKLIDYFRQSNIDFVKITPSHWSAIFQSYSGNINEFPRLTHLVFGGEPLLKTVVEKALAANVANHIFNHYGPTEATVGVSALKIHDANHIKNIITDVIPIGAPLGQTYFAVDTGNNCFKSKSAKGELFIGGPSVSMGYRGLPEENEKRFVNIKAENGQIIRCYRSGDYVELDEYGVASFIGRIDRQVKISGYRVELESIENIMRENLPIEGASVAYFEYKNKKWLVAAITSPTQEIDNVKENLQNVLPSHMVPQRTYRLDSFPRNENGKTNVKAIKKILEEKLKHELEGENATDSKAIINLHYQGLALKIYHGIRPIFHKYVSKSNCGINDNFFDLGGNSLDSVQLVADLQYKGYEISAYSFNDTPTIDGIISTVVKNRTLQVSAENKVERVNTNVFAAAQDFFFKENLKTPNVYNQSILFKIEESVDYQYLTTAVTLLCDQHELLRTSFVKSVNDEVIAQPIKTDITSILTRELLPVDCDIAGIVKTQSDLIQRSISLESGDVFKVHLFDSKEGDSYLLLVAHHISVDIISWRIVTSELTQIYCDLKDGVDITSSPVRNNFWDWVDHLKAQIPKIKSDTNASASLPIEKSCISNQIEHTEGSSETFWFAYTPEQSIELESVSAAKNIPLHTLFLGALAHEYGKLDNQNKVSIDVESHGRVSFDPNIDISRVVGWHTSTFSLDIEVDEFVFDKTLLNTKNKFDDVADLGVAESWTVHQHDDVKALYKSPICFNFLGDTDFPHDDRIKMVPSTLDVGKCRGADNDRFHNIKVSIQKMHGQYVIDMSYPNNCEKAQKLHISNLVHNYRASINSLFLGQTNILEPLIDKGTSTGSIHYCPKELIQGNSTDISRSYKTILLTGATGFIGVHCLKELLQTTSAELVCFVRANQGKAAEQRLYENWCWYFSKEAWQEYRNRIVILDSDLTKHNFGLVEEQYEGLKNVVDVIYHLAADTRLIGSTQDFYNTNISPLMRLLSFSKLGRIKDLHYMSTLAICGVNKDEVKFRESSLNIGQEFQNGYEKTKYQAEEIINQHVLDGYPAFIYRTGNVSGNSVSGKFQRNSTANRLIQFLNASTKLGVLPLNIDEQVNLSPVDIVTFFVVKLSLDHNQKPGVFHVDTPHYLSMRDLYLSLEKNGFQFNHSPRKNFSELFQGFDGTADADLALGKFWSSRTPRNVVYDHSKTLRKLEKLDCKFEVPTALWIDKFVQHLIATNAVNKSNPDLLHLGQFTRNRIFTYPNNPAVALKKTA